MGLFTSVIHVYQKSQTEVVNELSNELSQLRELSKVSNIEINPENSRHIISNMEGEQGVAAMSYIIISLS
jgi:hypothetical protein